MKKHLIILLLITIITPSAVSAKENAKVDLKVNGFDGPITVLYGSTVNLSWTSLSSITSCTPLGLAGRSWTDPRIATTGSAVTLPLQASETFTILCQDQAQKVSSSDKVKVNVVRVPSIIIPKTEVCSLGAKFNIENGQPCKATAGVLQIQKISSINNTSVAVNSSIIGDVNLDGIVNILDAQTIYRFNSGKTGLTTAQKLNADINKDGEVTTDDMDLITKFSMGIISVL